MTATHATKESRPASPQTAVTHPAAHITAPALSPRATLVDRIRSADPVRSRSQAPVARSASGSPEAAAAPAQPTAPMQSALARYLNASGQSAKQRTVQSIGVLAQNETTHPTPEAHQQQVEAAMVEPSEERQARSQSSQVDTYDQQTVTEPDSQASESALNQNLEAAAPTTLAQMADFQGSGKAQRVGSAVQSAITRETQTVNQAYEGIKSPPPPAPAERASVPLPAPEPASPTADLALGSGLIPDLQPEHTDLSLFSAAAEQHRQAAGLTQVQLAQVDEGDLKDAYTLNQSLKTRVRQAPSSVRQELVSRRLIMRQTLKQSENQARNHMRRMRTTGLSQSRQSQQQGQRALEQKRQAVANQINAMANQTRTQIKTTLANLEQQSMAAFALGQHAATQQFEAEVHARISAFKAKRYSGAAGPVKWLADKIFGIARFPEVQRALTTARDMYVRRISLLVRTLIRDVKLTILNCRLALIRCRTQIAAYVAGLSPELRAIGLTTLAQVSRELMALDREIRQKRAELIQKLEDQRQQAIQAIDARVAKLKVELGGAAAKVGQLLKNGVEKFFNWALKKAGLDGKRLMALLNRGAAVLGSIIRQPVRFLGNLVRAIRAGITQFSTNIAKHLMNGFMGWLTGALSNAGLQLPAKLNMNALLSVSFQVLGITWANIRQKLVLKLGEPLVAGVEKTVAIVKRLITDGPMAIVSLIQEKADAIKTQIMAGIRNWAIINLVKAGVVQLVKLFNPAGAIIAAIQGIYNTVMFFVENASRIATLVQTVLGAIGSIASGALGAAATAIEQAMARTIPVVLAFLSRLINLSGIGQAITAIIAKVRAPIDRALDTAVNWIADLARKVIKGGQNLGSRIAGWWQARRPFKSGNQTHTIFFDGQGPSAVLKIASTPLVLESYLADQAKLAPLDPKKVAEIRKKAAQIDRLKKDKSGNDIAMTKTQGELIGSHLAELAALLADIGGVLPKSVVDFDTVTIGADENGKKMTARPLSLNPGDTSGSEPTEYSQLYKTVAQRRNVYIRGHLLNHHLHGPGARKNLTPITNSLNQEMERQVEHFAKKAVLSDKKVVHYQVTAHYPAKPQPAPHIPDEGKLITKFTFSLKEMKRKPKTTGESPDHWTDGADIAGYTKTLHHHPPVQEPVGAVHTLINLSTITSAKEVIDAAIPGMTPAIAQTIFTAKVARDGLQFHSYSQLGLSGADLKRVQECKWVQLN